MGNKNDSNTPVSQQAQEPSATQSDVDRSSDAENERSSMTYEQLAERRSTPRSKTPFYKVMLGLNIVGWVGMVVVLILFHYARPDFISGVQQYWGIKSWSESHLSAMTIMLQVCLIVSLVSIIMRARRNRRQSDSFGINLFILFAIAAISLITLATTLGL